MATLYRLPRAILQQTFEHFRSCGDGRRECQALWLSAWRRPDQISEVVHPDHAAQRGGFVLEDGWLDAFWRRLGRDSMGVRIQVHTHPGAAFHSPIDDSYPIIHTPGFLSLVIPDFAQGPIGFERAYLTEIQPDGSWRQARIAERIHVS